MESRGGPPGRLVSLDVFRGLTIAAMLLVNNPGDWSHTHHQLLHAPWNGWTFTDLIFPFFLFIVGVAMVFAFRRRRAMGASRGAQLARVARRAVALMLLGFWGATFPLVPRTAGSGGGLVADTIALGLSGGLLRLGYSTAYLAIVAHLAGTKRARLWRAALLAGAIVAAAGALAAGPADPLWRHLGGARWPGVLVRIGWCYLFASLIYLYFPRPKAIVAWIAALLGSYWVWMLYVPIPGFARADGSSLADLSMAFPTLETARSQLLSNWCFFIDHHLMGEHVWSLSRLHDPRTRELLWSFDPEGILSTIPAVASVLIGVLAGQRLAPPDANRPRNAAWLLGAGAAGVALGALLALGMPINKQLWTSSYAVFMGGFACACLAACYYVIEVRGNSAWSRPFVWYGRNAITAFVGSGMTAILLARLKVPALTAAGTAGSMPLKRWIMKHFFLGWLSPINASLAFAICFVVVWALLMGLLHRQRIFLKI